MKLTTGLTRFVKTSDTRTENPATSKVVRVANKTGGSADDQPRVPAGNPDGGQWTK